MAIRIAAGAVAVWALWSILTSTRDPGRIDSVALLKGVGDVAADQTIRQLGGEGRVLVLTVDTGGQRVKSIEKMLARFQHRLARKSAVEIVGMEPVSVTFDPQEGLRGVPGQTFLDLVAGFSDVDGIVSFTGPPLLNADQVADWLGRNEPAPVIIAYNEVPESVLAAVRAGVVQVGIIPRDDVASNAEAASSPEEWFNRLLTLVTSENAAAIQASMDDASPRVSL